MDDPQDTHPPPSSSVLSTSSLATASLHSLLAAFPDAPTPEPYSSHLQVPSYLIDEMGVEDRVTQEILELYGLREEDSDEESRERLGEVLRALGAGYGVRNDPAGVPFPTLPLASSRASSGAGSWDLIDRNGNGEDLPTPTPARLGFGGVADPASLRTPPKEPVQMSAGSEGSFGSFQQAPVPAAPAEPSLSPTPSASPASDEEAPLLERGAGDFILLSSPDASPPQRPRTYRPRPIPQTALDEAEAVLAEPLPPFRRRLTGRLNVDSPAAPSSGPDPSWLIDRLLPSSLSLSPNGEHHIPTEDEQLLDALSVAQPRLPSLPRLGKGHRQGYERIPPPSASMERILRDPVEALVAKELQVTPEVLDFSSLPKDGKLQLRFRLTNEGNKHAVAFKVYHSAPEEQRARLRDTYGHIPRKVLEQYSRVIRMSPQVGIIRRTRNATVTVQLHFEDIELDFLRLLDGSGTIEVRTLLLHSRAERHLDVEGVAKLFRSKDAGKTAMTKQRLTFRLPAVEESSSISLPPVMGSICGLPQTAEKRKGIEAWVEDTDPMRPPSPPAEPKGVVQDEAVNEQMQEFCAKASLLRARIDATKEMSPADSVEIGQASPTSRYISLAVLGLTATLFIAILLQTTWTEIGPEV